MKLLLGANPNLETATLEGNTALLRAVKNRKTETVSLLLEKKAKMTATDETGDTVGEVEL